MLAMVHETSRKTRRFLQSVPKKVVPRCVSAAEEL